MTKILLLAGTAEARALAAHLARIDGLQVTASLAGATNAPENYACPVRVGGFGGAAGLSEYLRQSGTDLLIDATHPFAAIMQANACAAAETAGLARLRLLRPPWPARSNWIEVADLGAAAEALPAGAKVLLTTGRKDIAPFKARTDSTFILRSIEEVRDLPDHITPLRARPPFTHDSERGLFAMLGLTHLVTKNAGGAGIAKLDVADALRLTTLMISRPPPPPGRVVTSVDAAVAWVLENVVIQKSDI